MGVRHEKKLLEPHISRRLSRLKVEQKVTIQMHQTVPKTKSHVRSPLYRGSYQHDSGVRDSRHPKGARLMKVVSGDGSEDKKFTAERDRFINWLYQNRDLESHQKARYKKTYKGAVEQAIQDFPMVMFRRFGKGKNKLREIWRDVEMPLASTRKNPEKELTTFLKKSFNYLCIDVMKKRTFKEAAEQEFKEQDQQYTGREVLIPDFSIFNYLGDGNDPFRNLDNSEIWTRIRFCLRMHCRSKHLATYIGIINFWEVGIREPKDICPNIAGLTPSSYNDLQGALIDFLKKHRDCWFNDEDGEDQS